jgi:hypothetical protein
LRSADEVDNNNNSDAALVFVKYGFGFVVSLIAWPTVSKNFSNWGRSAPRIAGKDALAMFVSTALPNLP